MPTATGDLNSTDVDNPADAWQAVAAGDRQRQWLRQLRARRERGVDLHARRQQCGRCRRSTAPRTLTDSFTALTADGTAQVVTITITAPNDAAGDQRHHHRQR